MGTNGSMIFVIDGERKPQYVHNDSFPDTLGVAVLKWLRKEHDRPETYEAVRNLKHVVNATDPTPEQQAELAEYTDLGVSDQSPLDWYCLLRRCQGDPAATLAAGYVYGEGPDGFFTYTADFDAKTFTAAGYGGEVLGSWSFGELPTKNEFLKLTEEDEDDE